MMNDTVDKIEKYADEVLVGAARYYDQVEEFPEEHVKKLFDLGFFESLYPNNTVTNYQAYLANLSNVSHHFPALASIMLTQESHALWPFSQFGTEEQQADYFNQLLTGQQFGAFALNEEHSGSDYTEMETVARKVEGGWQLTGAKQYISNAPVAEVFLIAARIEQINEEDTYGVFIVRRQVKGFEIGLTEEKMGIKALPVASLVLNEVFVAESALLGGQLNGEQQIRSILNRNRLAVTAQAIGISEGAMKRALGYVSRKRNIGKRLIDLQNTQYKLAEIETKLFAANALLNQVVMTNPDDERLVAMAKLTASNDAIETTETIISLVGGYGYMKHNDIERLIRDAKITAIYGSSSNRLRKIIADPWTK
ncbi:acyl-CoA dehydrogenase family protein [Vagococcus zengguangii]|uniref:Acyl-CoA dehydrogenase n=1 Tax=Vagococcus zengguangii TaxID=2571750 RepID=A0A4D7CSQ3_9ENTE|nr:acyl-CoA dehydrogenase family protein [Vagococcus zengguangii]QCI85742.1 acyl-CoA dehydrogenase [Vagococcus zengguangii]TLG81683.1 acyl-CoA dehydrogenase [Vagococcus zengguangii]